MIALERLSAASNNFKETIAAYNVSYKAINLVLQQTFDADEPYSKYSQLEQTYRQAGFTSDFALFVEDCERIENNDYYFARKNVYLGICSAFDEFTHSCIAALSYEASWRNMSVGERMRLETSDADFYEKFRKSEASASGKKRGDFLTTKFNNLIAEELKVIDGIFWLRNQLTHNLNKAKEGYPDEIFSKKYEQGTEIRLDSKLMSDSVQTVRRLVKRIYDESPYLDTFNGY